MPRSLPSASARSSACLATNLSQREIGGALYVSLNTVKTHTRGIFRKLHASNRREAVERARTLGLI
jgi:LuxR family transcriptional regulator, maltose regulon positive regulatory protein